MNGYNSLQDLLLLDIETVPGAAHFQDLPDEWKALWEAKISKTVPENSSPAEFYGERAGIMAEFGRIICVSTGYFLVEKGAAPTLKIKSFYGHNEVEILNAFLHVVDKFRQRSRGFQFVGHNIREFDIPFICRRMLANGILIPPHMNFSGMKPWEVNMVDTMQLWKFGDYKNYTSLRLLAAVLNVPTPKDDIDGSMVAAVYYQEKDLDRIVRYCQKDVVAVANVILRMDGLPLLETDHIAIV